MTIRSTFHILVLLVVLLIFSSHSVFGRGPRPTKREVERKQNPIEAQAKRDAEADMNKLLWTGVGFAVYGFLLTGVAAGVHKRRGSGFDGAVNGAVCGGTVGMTFGLVTIWAVDSYKLTPPPERLLGKSPQYIDVYTDVYKTRTQQLRGQYVAGGCGLAAMIVMIVVLIEEQI